MKNLCSKSWGDENEGLEPGNAHSDPQNGSLERKMGLSTHCSVEFRAHFGFFCVF